MGALSGITSCSGPGPTAISPTNGRSCAAISNTEAPMPVAKIVMVIAPDRRSSLCTIAIAVRAQIACRIRHAHFTAFDLRAADDDTLQARVERIADRRRDLALRDALAVIVRRQAERQLQRLREERRRKAQRRALMRQFRPFLDDGFFDVCTDQPAQSLARLREIG